VRALWFMPLTFIAGIDGFGWFMPYLLVVVGVAAVGRRVSRARRLHPLPAEIVSSEPGELELESAPT